MKYLIVAYLVLSSMSGYTQDSVLVLSKKMFDDQDKIMLADTGRWIFKKGNDPSWADPNLNTTGWDTLKPTGLKAAMADKNGRLEGWFRLRIVLDSSFKDLDIGILQKVWAATDIYIDGDSLYSFGNTGLNGKPYHEYKREVDKGHKISLSIGKEHLIAVHFVDVVSPFYGYGKLKSQVKVLPGFINITGPEYVLRMSKEFAPPGNMALIAVLAVLAILFWLLFIFNRKEKHLLYLAINVTFFFTILLQFIFAPGGISFITRQVLDFLSTFLLAGFFVSIPLSFAEIFVGKTPKFYWYFIATTIVIFIGGFLYDYLFYRSSTLMLPLYGITFILSAYYLIRGLKKLNGAKWALIIGLMTFICLPILLIVVNVLNVNMSNMYVNLIGIMMASALPLSLLIYIVLWIKEMIKEIRQKANDVIRVTEEKKDLLENQNKLLELKVTERTQELNQSIVTLKSTQTQLIQSEKMASLGELTAGIAHEIQNPLNFVNNFSEVNKELVDELDEEANKGNLEEVKSIAKDIKDNEEKINHHGKRADAIVKNMLQHSRTSSGLKEPTDINALADEYLRLSYHGLRAKDKTFNAKFEMDFDNSIEKINVVPQEMGRVILNLINNAFYAVSEKKKQVGEGYDPTVTVTTKQSNGSVEINVRDNGNGIPQKVLDKIFQPFFTTKPTGQGTGLGLSLSYDIVKAHGGELKVETKAGEGSEFIIQLPV